MNIKDKIDNRVRVEISRRMSRDPKKLKKDKTKIFDMSLNGIIRQY